MTITARYASRCASCQQAITPGQQIEWRKGAPSRHTSCGSASSTTTTAPARRRVTACLGCGGPLDAYQQRHGRRYCSTDCYADRQLGGQSGYVHGVWHQGSED